MSQALVWPREASCLVSVVKPAGMAPWFSGMLCQCRQAKEKLQDGSEWAGSTAVPRQGIGVPEPFPHPGALLCSRTPRVQNLEDGCVFFLPCFHDSMWLCSERRTSLTGTWEGCTVPVPSHNCSHTHGASWASSPPQLEHRPSMQGQPAALYMLGCSAGREGDWFCISPQEAAPAELGCSSLSPKPSNKAPTLRGAVERWGLPYGAGMRLRSYCSGAGAGIVAGAHTGAT